MNLNRRKRSADLHLKGEIRRGTFFRRQEREYSLRRQAAQTGVILCVEQRRLSVQTKKPAIGGHTSHVSAIEGNSRLDGGRDRDRTCDPLHVKEVLFR